MTGQERIAAALELANQGQFSEARNILNIVEMGRRVPQDEMRKAWAKFSKKWRGE